VGQLGLPELIVVLVLVFFMYVGWRIVARTGNSGALSLLFLVPLANIAFMLYLGFAEWPVEKELKVLREQSNRPSG
jgi:hypothetical protein